MQYVWLFLSLEHNAKHMLLLAEPDLLHVVHGAMLLHVPRPPAALRAAIASGTTTSRTRATCATYA